MTRLTVREYFPEDYFEVKAQEFTKGKLSEEQKIVASVAHKLRGPHYTILSPEVQIIACVGIHLMWEGTGEVWGLYSPLMRQYPMGWFESKRLLDMEQKRHKLKRLQAITQCDWPEARRFVEHLGFHAEGKLEAYWPWGADAMMYARLERS